MNVTECWPYFCGISPLFVEVLRLFKFEFIIMPRLSSRTDLSNITKKIGIKIMQIRVLCIWVNLFFFFWNILLSNSQMLSCVACNKHLTFCKIILRRFSFLKSLKIDAKKTQQTKNLEIAKKPGMNKISRCWKKTLYEYLFNAKEVVYNVAQLNPL